MPAYLHKCTSLGGGAQFSISWIVETYMPRKGYSSQAYHERVVDTATAQRFCKKHGVSFPSSNQPSQ